MIKHLNILIKGNMKNRGYAFRVMKEADKMNIKGVVSYTKDNELYIQAEGNENILLDYFEWCKSNIIDVSENELVTSYGKCKNFQDFRLNV